MWNKQEAFVEDKHRFTICSSGTKTGKTLGSAIWLVKKAWMNPKSLWWWVAPVYKQVDIGFRRCRELIPEEHRRVNEAEKKIRLDNGSIIEGRSGEKPDNLYGEGVFGAVLDEADRMREEAWQAFRTTITQTQGPVKLISNPVKKGSWFHNLWKEGRRNLPDSMISSHMMKTIENPFINPEEVDIAKGQLPEDVFRSLYEAEWPEGEGLVFRNFTHCIMRDINNVDNYFAQGPKSYYTYIIGCDLAKTVDFTVLIVMERETRRVVDILRMQNVNWNEQKSKMMEMSLKWNNAQLVIDESGVGVPICDDLEVFGYNIVRVKTHVDKKDVIQKLTVALNQRLITFPKVDWLLEELEVYGYELTRTGKVRYTAPHGYSDDGVIALGLCCVGLDTFLYQNIYHQNISNWEQENYIKSMGVCYGEQE